MNLYAVAWSFVKGNTYYVDSTFEVASDKEQAIGRTFLRLQSTHPISEGCTGHQVLACLIPDEFINWMLARRKQQEAI